jgi:hypothetical protein
MNVIEGGCYLEYYPSAAAMSVISTWKSGAIIRWEVDPETQKPRTVHLVPATAANKTNPIVDGWQRLAPVRSYKLKAYGHQRPHLSVPTREVGAAVRSSPRAVEEVEVSPSIISVRVPFAFRVAKHRRLRPAQ